MHYQISKMTQYFLTLSILLSPLAKALPIKELPKDWSEFEKVISQKEIVITFDNDIILSRKKGSDFASFRFEESLNNSKKDQDCQNVTVKCDLSLDTKKDSVHLGSTDEEGPWTITKIEKIDYAIQKWTLSRKKQNLDMTCVALEKNGEKLEIATMQSDFIHRALTATKSTVDSKIQVATESRTDD